MQNQLPFLIGILFLHIYLVGGILSLGRWIHFPLSLAYCEMILLFGILFYSLMRSGHYLALPVCLIFTENLLVIKQYVENDEKQ